MKDITVKNIPKEALYKDIVIVGNGPSGISLSYMLTGNWPYWNTEKIQKHPDELLRARLNYADSSKSLMEQDLLMLADGLEGRSTNPISLLVDSLEHPCADLGMELPPMLEYKHHPNAQIDHIVLGKGPPGGAWHKMDPNLRTLSLAGWMSLPGLSFREWESLQTEKSSTKDVEKVSSDNRTKLRINLLRESIQNSPCEKCLELRNKQKSKDQISGENSQLVNNNESEIGALCCRCTKALTTKTKINNQRIDINDISVVDSPGKVPPRRNLSLKRQVSKEVQTRALVSRVAQYYENYVHLMNLTKYFLNDVLVTLVAPIQDGCAQGKYRSARWMVMGINKLNGRPFYYACKNVVLANGASDLANRLGLHGEDINRSWVKHELPQLESALESLTAYERSDLKPVLVIGAGLSAADAVTICRSSDIHVIHVFRSRSAGLDKMLPENVYPEYHEVHRMMKDPINNYEFYTPVPEYTISDLTTDLDGTHRVTVQHLKTGSKQTFEVSFCAILIGSKPDLRFISTTNKNVVRSISISNSIFSEKSISNSEYSQSSLGRRISWLKAFCAKCKNINLCDWNRRCEYKKVCGHNRICECNKINSDNETISISCTVNQNGLGLGIDPTKSIDCKTNQIAVDKYTNEVLNTPKGLYAMGPLVGDNFVRFIPGGALAIAAALNREND